MDLSTGVASTCSDEDSLLDDILDLSGLDLDNEETWLYKSPHESETANVQDWLSGKNESQLPPEFASLKLKSSSAIDTRTFTRPKKKTNRPSINEIERMYNSESEGASGEDKPNFRSKVPQTVQEDQELGYEMERPLKFDLSQPTSNHNFDSFVSSEFSMISSNMSQLFDMSPPSLMMDSLTFSNIMDSSFIKNDAVLSKIRDKDYTETVLLQDFEAPMFQSITESCSSLNSDTPENFLKKVTRDHNCKNSATVTENNDCTNTPDRVFSLEASNPSDNSESRVQNSTFPKEAAPNSTQIAELPKNSSGILNGTYRRPLKHNGTFTKADCTNNRLSGASNNSNAENSSEILNETYCHPLKYNGTFTKADYTNNRLSDVPNSIHGATGLENDIKGIKNSMNHSNTVNSDTLQSTITKYNNTEILRSDSVEEMKKRLSSCSSSIEQLNGMGCSQEDMKVDMNALYTDNKVASETTRTMDMKRSSLGSADSLDRMSSLSGSSRGSHKRMSMEDVHAIAEMQEQSLDQVMSTPNGPVGKRNFLWNTDFLSPITVKENISDSELSDEYKSAKSHASSKIRLNTWEPVSAKSLSCLAINNALKTNQRTAYTLAGQRPAQPLQSNLRGSCTNINSMQCTSPSLGGSHQNLYKSSKPPIASQQPIKPAMLSNLKTMGSKLKGSYTSLRPISAKLPVVPPKDSTDEINATFCRPQTAGRSPIATSTKSSTTRNNVPTPTRTISNQSALDSTFVHPQVVRASALPRPTGIPRPASRIPGPRSNILR